MATVILAAYGCNGQGPAEPTEPLTRIDLRAALGVADANPVGVTVGADGQWFIFDQIAGLLAIDRDGTARSVMTMEELPNPGVEIRYPFTDVVALGAGRFALTAIGDGFLLDTVADSLRLYFCYEPGDFPDETQQQRTDAVAYDSASDQLVAQPRTFDRDTNEVLASAIGYYDARTGLDVQWVSLPLEFAAGGMATTASGELLLGSGADLYRLASGQLQRAVRLDAVGVRQVEGLSLDREAGSLLVLDGDDQLLELALDAVGIDAD